MEVHHHSKAEKKNFKEYFLEFLMIFLAVTMGFFAETIRESIIEHERAKEFAASMVKDLDADTAQLNSYRIYFSSSANNVDTLLQLFAAADPQNIPSGKLYWYGLFGGAHRYFVPNDATIQQMKSSGSLRYFKKVIATDVAKYDRFCRLIQSNEGMQQNIYTEVRKVRAMIFDFKYNDIANKLFQDNKTGFDYRRIDSFMKTDPPLLSRDKTLFNQYVELVRSRFLRTNIAYADSALHQASVLLGELKAAYHIK